MQTIHRTTQFKRECVLCGSGALVSLECVVRYNYIPVVCKVFLCLLSVLSDWSHCSMLSVYWCPLSCVIRYTDVPVVRYHLQCCPSCVLSGTLMPLECVIRYTDVPVMCYQVHWCPCSVLSGTLVSL